MVVNGMNHFQEMCKGKLINWYMDNMGVELTHNDVYVVWSCKALQNYKCLTSTSVDGDGVYAEYTYNGDKKELYEDVYIKLTNKCHTEG